MIRKIVTALTVVTMLVGAAASGFAADVQNKKGTPVYRPPIRGAPVGRVGGGTRGTSDGRPHVAVLAPDHVGLTRLEQPMLYWFLDRPTTHAVEVTIIEAEGVKPLFERRVQAPAAGIYALSLSDAGVRLKPGMRYQWFVAVIVDPDYRSKDILSGAIIERLAPAADGSAAAGDDTGELAAAGLWYDALMAVSTQIDVRPTDPTPRQHRQALLEQIGLSDVARFDRER
jgi:hypothetical protein